MRPGALHLSVSVGVGVSAPAYPPPFQLLLRVVCVVLRDLSVTGNCTHQHKGNTKRRSATEACACVCVCRPSDKGDWEERCG